MPHFPVQSAEQQRIERILTSPAAKGRENQAQHLAFRTRETVDAAIATLKASATTDAPSGNPSGAGFDTAVKAKGIDARAMYADRAANTMPLHAGRQAAAHGRQAQQDKPTLDADSIYAGRRRAQGQE